MKIALYDWAPSPFCLKVRALLDHKNIAYDRRPALSAMRQVRRRGGIGKVPALEIDGAFIVDSTNIAHELERRFPMPPTLPPDPRDRALCHALEDWCDESLYFYGLYYHWQHAAGRRQTGAYFARSLTGRLAFHLLQPRMLRQIRGQGLGRKAEQQVREDLDRQLEAIEGLLGTSPFLLGDAPYLCDFALMSQLVYLQRAPAMRDVLENRPAARGLLERLREVRR
jgi:glutathione S-transferase